MRAQSVATILNDAAIGLGLFAYSDTDILNSGNENVQVLGRLLWEVGDDLLWEHPWSWLQKTATISTVASTAYYSLPDDYGSYISDTAWNRTQTTRIRGPVSPKEWETIQAQNVSASVSQAFRIYNNKFYITPAPTAVETVAYEYQSDWWVSAAAGTAPTKYYIEVQEDLIWFPRQLVIKALKLKYSRLKGFDTVAFQREYDETLAAEIGRDSPGQTLNLNGGSGFRLIDGRNIPDTGYGD